MLPANAAVICCSRLSVTSTEKCAGTIRAISRTSSWTGLPSVTPHVASGWPMWCTSCSVITVLRPARPGATIFGSAAESGEEMRFDEAGGDADVGIQPCAIEEHLDARGRHARASERRGIARVVIDDAVACSGCRGRACARARAAVLIRCVPVAIRMVTSSGRTCGISSKSATQHLAPRLRARDVADGNRDPLAGAHLLAKRRAVHRRPDRGEQRRARIGGRGPRDRLDDGDALVGKIDLEAVRPVVQSYSHLVSVVGSW